MSTIKSRPTVPAFRNVDAALVPRGAPRPRIIDVREPAEFNGPLGHIPGAELVPLGMLEASARAWDREAPVVVVCRSGARSARAATLLVQLGFRDIVNLEGGTQRYAEAGLPVERG